MSALSMRSVALGIERPAGSGAGSEKSGRWSIRSVGLARWVAVASAEKTGPVIGFAGEVAVGGGAVGGRGGARSGDGPLTAG